MAEKTGISWTDKTFNPWWGCTKVSPACDYCYAATIAKNRKMPIWGAGAARHLTSVNNHKQPFVWNRQAARLGRRYRVFCLSMGDVMDGEVPQAWREELWETIDQTPHLDWQLLTKRPENYHRYLPTAFKHNNVWLGTTAENQHYFDVRWRAMQLLRARFPQAPLWISYEPALGPVTVVGAELIPNWIIFGGESGSGARPIDVEWARDIRDECARLGISFFMKQMASHSIHRAKHSIPEDLKIRQYPDDPHAEWTEPEQNLIRLTLPSGRLVP
jgi:protein gp37